MATDSTQTTAETVPASLPATIAPRQANMRFALVYAGLGLVLAGSVAAFAVFAVWPSLHPSAKWSSWRPHSAGPIVMAKSIADHVGAEYRFVSGGQLVAVVASAPAVTSGTQTVGIVAVATRSRVGGKQSVRPLTPGATLMYTLCGLGSRCAIASGTPSEARGQLVRREGLEVALYTFKYIPSVDSVLVYMPPAQGAATAPILYFTKDSLSGRLNIPLKDTLLPKYWLATPGVGVTLACCVVMSGSISTG